MRSWPLPHWVPNAGLRLEASGQVLAYTGDSGPSPLLAELARGAGVFLADNWPDRAVQIGYAIPVVGEVLVAKDVVDTTIGIGQAAGQAAADSYLAVVRAKDAILDPLKKLIPPDPCADVAGAGPSTAIWSWMMARPASIECA